MFPKKTKIEIDSNKQQIILDGSMVINKGLKNIKIHK